ncbi:MAG: SDR family oxidoreductase [Chloroflexi bacterium]|nr:SDR family oxidoreductase [Chloroflexota bacterium]
MTQLQRLDGAVGIVTGAGRGIGAAIARELSGLGARLVLADLVADRLAEVVAGIAAADGNALPVVADVRQYTDTERLRDACLAHFGRIDFAVANAGVSDASTLADGDPERWRAVIETNVLGVAHTVRAVLPALREQGDGHLVLIASVSGREAYAGEPIYIASKWAVVGLGYALRKETVGTGVRATLIEPGLVDTPLARSHPFASAWMETIDPLRDEDVARAVAYVLTQPKHMAINELVLRPVAQEV